MYLFIYFEFYLKSPSASPTAQCPMLYWQGIISLNVRRGLRKPRKSLNQDIRNRQINGVIWGFQSNDTDGTGHMGCDNM